MRMRVTFYISLLLFIFASINILPQAPVITKQPKTQGVIEGDSATFFIEVTGDTLTYQWYKDGAAISGATDSMYTTPATVLADDSSLFSVKVTNSHGSDSSKAVALYVTASGARVTGGELVLYNFNEGSGNTINDVSGVGDPYNLTINKPSGVEWTDHGLLVIDSALIKSTSNDLKITNTVKQTNEITVEFWLRSISIENNIVFALTLGSADANFFVETYVPFGYNWAVRTTTTDNHAFPGTLDTTGVNTNLVHLVLTRSSDGVSKIYRDGIEVASKNIGGDCSNWSSITYLSLASFLGGEKPWKGIFYLAAVYGRALDSAEVVHNFIRGTGVDDPLIVEQPQDKKILVGYDVTFSSKAVGHSPISYQWQKNGTDISGATDSLYTISKVNFADSGNVYRVIATNTSGSDTSNNAVLSVIGVSADCPDGIIHYYHLSETTSPYKDTVGFSDGTSSTPPTPVQGIVGTAQSFSNQKINIPDDRSFDWKSNESFSIEFWIKTNSTPSDAEVVVGRRYSSSANNIWWIGLNSNAKVVFQLTDSGGSGVTIGDKGSALSDNAWHLIAAVRDNDNGKNYLYVDGVKIDSAVQSYSAGFEGTNDVSLGYINFTPYYYYSGLLDEVAFYSVALTEAVIQNQYNKGLKGLGYCELVISAPSDLKAIKDTQDTTNVKLSWSDNSSNELGFVIQRKLGDSASVAAYSNIDTVAANVTSYVDTTTTDTTKYTYRLYAYNADTVSAFSNIATIVTVLPVELTSFTANVVDGKVVISWGTATEINNAGFSIERSNDNKKFTEIAFVKGKGTSTDKSIYNYTDKSALSGKYYYRLKQVDFDGTYQYYKSIEIDLGLPKNYSLEQNYPNPFNPSTTIRFALTTSAKVNIKLYNTLGQEVATILNGELNAGIHETIFNASNLSSGVYFYRLEVHGADGSNFVSTKRMLLMK